jgi:hypothetical protein
MKNKFNDDEEMNQQLNPKKEEKGFLDNLIDNPREAIAKEVIDQAQEKISQNWFDKCKCNFEYNLT